ncbi:MAG: hypothetical protein JO103_09010 [Candidatus Eremiobacteraeota bacterium]|nr:hypothetical protein [Candidatus Eremiobacteraeota bacterium]MBV9409481.1 hypothetical protein [Candidatus Eremiobacteraeota bacterium]
MSARFVYRLVAACALAGVLAGCGGGSGSMSVPVPSTGGNATSQNAARVAGSIVIKIPAPNTSSATRRPQYVAATSGSAKITINAAAGCTQCSGAQTIEIALTGPGAPCTTGTPKTCTIPLSLAPGTYAADMVIDDGPTVGGYVSGMPLSQNAFPITIAAGTPNVTAVTLYGVPISVTLTNITPATMFNDTAGGKTTYRVLTAGATGQLALVAKDADNNVIAGPGAPVWAASASGGGFTASIDPSTNTVSVIAPATATRTAGNLQLTSTSPSCTAPNAVCSYNVPIGFAELLAVADHGFPHITVWPIGGSAPLAIITTGTSFPYNAVTFAPNGTLFVANGGNNTVTAYAPPYTAAPTVISAQLTAPTSLATDSKNNLYVLDKNAAQPKFVVYPPPYTTTTPQTLNLSANPVMVYVDSGDHLWSVGGDIYRWTLPYTGQSADVGIGGAISTLSAPAAFAIDGSGRAYVADGGTNAIVRFDPPFSASYNQAPALTIPSTVAQPIAQPHAIAVAPDGTIFLATANVTNLYSQTGSPAGSLPGMPTAPIPQLFAADANGTMWEAIDLGPPVGFSPPYNVSTFQLLSNTGGFLTPNAVAIWP